MGKRWPYLAVQLTTACTRACPDCCYHVPTLPPEHFSWEYFELAAERVRAAVDGVGWLFASGGEPTLHPDFARVVREFKRMFNADQLCVATNGARLLEYLPLLENVDKLHLTMFDGNDEIRDAVVATGYQGILYARPAEHLPMVGRPGYIYPCNTDRKYTVTLWRGRAYRCCMGPGLPSAASIPVEELTYNGVMVLQRGCDTCPYANPARRRDYTVEG